MRYCPVPSVTAERVFSINAGLAASTLTPGSTAPDESFTAPAIVAWANAGGDNRTITATKTRVLTITRILPPQMGNAPRRHEGTKQLPFTS
jgi:hypothetical protein